MPTIDSSSTVTIAGRMQRQRHLEEGAELARPVDAGGVEQLVGHRVARVDAHQVDAERVEQRRQDDRPDRVGEARPARTG